MILFETERLTVRRFTANDADDFFLLNSDPEAMHFIRAPKTREESDAFLTENLRFYLDSSALGRYAVYEKTTGGFAGTFSFLYLSGEADFHIGYALLPAAWGKGFATELVGTGTPYFFQRTGRKMLFAITDAGNLASQHVLLKSGYSRSGQVEEHGQMLELFAIAASGDHIETK
ncbi:MAG: family N-acetyltransferase [Sediminibacterium sp.]|nr:family N-acetyltransferase [Sediminibacterium sp.]